MSYIYQTGNDLTKRGDKMAIYAWRKISKIKKQESETKKPKWKRMLEEARTIENSMRDI